MARNFSHAEIKARTLGSRRDRTGLIAAGNPDVLSEAHSAQPADVSNAPKLRSGPAWSTGLRAWGGPQHHPGKQDTPDIGRKKVITY
jgi:hypothetical protein